MRYEDLLREQLDLKEKVILSELPQDEIISFGGIKFHENMNLSFFSNERLVLAHSCVHTFFSKKNKFFNKNKIRIMHNKIVNEMKTRGLNHLFFDNLDKD